MYRLAILFLLFNLPACEQPPQEEQLEAKTFSNKLELPPHEENWDFYIGLIDSNVSSTFVDLGFLEISPLEGFDHLAHVSITLNDPNPENNLSSSSEAPKLIQIENYIEKHLTEDTLSTYVGRYTSNGFRDLCFFTQDTTEFFKRMPNILSQYPEYNFDYGVQLDPNWEVYSDFLYPSPKQFQTIQNRKVLENLETNNDPLTDQRLVEHWIFFKSDSDRGSFIEEIKELNFIIVEKWFEKENSELYPFALQISRIDKVGYNDIDNVTHPILDLAIKYNGDYDGWETSVEN